jgi:hypothetical protein
MGSLTRVLFASALVFALASADFHFLMGKVAGSNQKTEDVVSFAHLQEYDCKELGDFHAVKKDSGSDAFTSPILLCGVRDIVFHHQSNGNFILTNSGGDAGVCYPNEAGPTSISCSAFGDLTEGPGHYICTSHVCSGKKRYAIH